MARLDELIAGLGIPDDEVRQAVASGTLLPLIAEYYLLPGERRHDIATAADRAGVPLADAVRVWRALGLTDPSAPSIHQRPEGPAHAVGFADLVGFTALSQRLPTGDLSRLIVDFERAAHDITTGAGGWIVKTIGDEVMFAATDPMSAAAIAIGLVGDMPDELPPLRVAVAWGPVLPREGDCFGPTVNRAARLVSAAQPGQALVDDHLRDLIGERFRTTSAGAADLKDLGRVELWGLAAP